MWVSDECQWIFFIGFFRFFGGIVLGIRATVVVVNKDTIPVRFCSREEYVFNGLSRVRTGCIHVDVHIFFLKKM